MVEDEVIANQLEDLLTPAITNQENYYRKLGLRDRILNLPLMSERNFKVEHDPLMLQSLPYLN